MQPQRYKTTIYQNYYLNDIRQSVTKTSTLRVHHNQLSTIVPQRYIIKIIKNSTSTMYEK
jgi:hypothetical protein